MNISFKRLLDKTFWKFILVGIANTLFGTAVMFVFYNVFNFGYWFSSASNYVLGSILSYFLNKYFTFKSRENSFKSILKFAVNITACYLAAYSLAKPAVAWMFSDLSNKWQGNISLLAGMCVFVLLNYVGQRFFVFKEKSDK